MWSGKKKPTAPTRTPADTPAVITRDDMLELLARAGNESAPIVRLDRDAEPARGHDGVCISLAPAELRSPRNLLDVDVVLETDSTFYMISPHLQHNLQVRSWLATIPSFAITP